MAGNELFSTLSVLSGVMVLELARGVARFPAGDNGGGEDHEKVAAGDAF